MHAAQVAAINTYEMFLDVAQVWPFLLYFMEIFGAKKLEVFENGSKFIPLNELSIWHFKNYIFINYLCLLSEKKDTNKKTNEQLSWHFLLNNPLLTTYEGSKWAQFQW